LKIGFNVDFAIKVAGLVPLLCMVAIVGHFLLKQIRPVTGLNRSLYNTEVKVCIPPHLSMYNNPFRLKSKLGSVLYEVSAKIGPF